MNSLEKENNRNRKVLEKYDISSDVPHHDDSREYYTLIKNSLFKQSKT